MRTDDVANRLTVWLTVTTRTQRAVVTAIAVSILTAGCALSSTGTAIPERKQSSQTSAPTSPPSSPSPFAWLASVLPNSAELSTALGYSVTVDELPSVGDITRLRNTMVGSRSVTEPECIGVISSLEKVVYDNTPILAVTSATEAAATFGAVAFDSAKNAQIAYARFADQWLRCDGRTMRKSAADYVVEHTISDVDVVDNVLYATDTVTSTGGDPVVVKRALGVALDCIVEVELPLDARINHSPGMGDAGTLIDAMAGRVKTVQR